MLGRKGRSTGIEYALGYQVCLPKPLAAPLMVWIKDCPGTRVSQMDDAQFANAFWVEREFFTRSKSMTQVDKRRVEDDDNFLGTVKRFVCLDSDLKRIDENTKIIKLPSQASSSYQIEELEGKMRAKIPGMFESRMDQGNCVDIPGARYMVRQPTPEQWRSRDISLTFVQLAFKRPALKVVEFEPAKKKGLNHYEKELVSLEEALLADIQTERSKKEKDESILAGQNVDGKGEVIVFRQAENVRTTSTHIPKHLVVHTQGVDHLMQLLKREDELRAFRFTPGTISSEILPEGATPYNLFDEKKVDNLKPKAEPTEERRIYEVPDGADESPESVAESDVYSSSGSDSMKSEPVTPEEKGSSPEMEETVRPTKRPRESESTSSDSDPVDDYEDTQDWSDPNTCIELFQRLKKHPIQRISYETQRTLKRLDEKHFLARRKRKAKKMSSSRKWNSNMKEKLNKLITNSTPAGASAIAKGEKPKNLCKRLKLEPTQDVESKNSVKKEPKEDAFETYLNKYEEELSDPDKTLVVQEVAGKNNGHQETVNTTGDDLAYEPDVTFVNNETIGKNCSLTLCALSKVIARSPDGSGVRSLRPEALQTVMYFFTGKSILQFEHAGSLEFLFNPLSYFLITSSRTCMGPEPVAGTEMISGTTMAI